MKKLMFLASISCLVLAGKVNAQYLSGYVEASSTSLDPEGLATSSSIHLAPTNIISSTTGSFAGIVLPNSLLQTPNPQTISGISSAKTPVSINDYIEFSAADSFSGMSVAGTTPPNRFEYNLLSLAESYPFNGPATFAGTGTIVDTTGAFQDTPAILTVGFFNANNYTIILQAEPAPEPGTISLIAAGLLGMRAWRRRRERSKRREGEVF